jgi:N-acetylglutamate synthase-like GNAT family acetyltransferase
MTKSDVRLVPTTTTHCKQFFKRPVPHRLRALTALVDDEVIGIGGMEMLPDGQTAAFLEVSEETAKKYPVALMKASRQIVKQAKDLGLRRMVALADTRRPAAERFLKRLGFEFASDEDGEVVYLWQG